MTETETDDATKALTAVGASLAKSNDDTDAPAWAVDLIQQIEDLEARVEAYEQNKNAWKHELIEQVEKLDEEIAEIEDDIE